MSIISLRLNHKLPESLRKLIAVSIPSWYDYNENKYGEENCWYGVSIPRWYDYNKVEETDTKMIENVSIPRWYDYNLNDEKWPAYMDYVSIPRWYDYNPNLYKSVLFIKNCFNSTMVRLQLRNSSNLSRALVGFNSTMVRLQPQ